MSALTRKLLRQFWQLRGQALAIGVVIGGGVAMLVMSLSSLDSMTLTREAYYRDYRFADVFATLKRAPESLRESLAEIPGVQQLETRVVASVNLDIPGFADPATGLIISLPDGRNATLNSLYLREGRLPEPGSEREVVVNEAFAEAHGFRPGDRLAAIINGRWQDLVIAGIGLSPEYIYHIKPGDLFPDFERFGILWMNRSQLAAAYDMDGAFNDVVLSLSRDARTGDVIDRLDALLDPYGGRGAIDRDDQLSHRYLEVEFKQLRTMATIFPAIFLGVAAFLLNVVMTRLIGNERDQIAILKAFGYSNWQVGLHYLQLVLLVIAIGLLIGTAAGLWFGKMLSGLYQMFFRFPFLEYQARTGVISLGALVTVAAGVLGALGAVRRAVVLPPAEAMRPEPPPVFRATLVERLGLQRWFSQPTRMILRSIERRPVKSLLTVVGIAMACGILMVGRFQEGSLDFLIRVQYHFAQRDDLMVTFVEPTSARVVDELRALPGVYGVEAYRVAPAIVRHGNRYYRTAVQGLEPAGVLRRVLDDQLRVRELPEEGLLLNDFLAEFLGAGPGDAVTVEFLDGRRDQREVPVAGIVREYTGVAAYMSLAALNRLTGDGTAVSGAHLAVDADQRDAVVARLKDVPRVAGVSDRYTAIRNFYESMAEIVLVNALLASILGGSIAVGVVYNSARIALTERSRELASLRVLGFTRGEISYILLGELALLTLAAIPLGFLVGIGLTAYIIKGIESDLYRIPMVIQSDVYALAAGVVIVATVLSGLLVARRLYHLDLVAVLKTRE